jgi:hypothetical protein
VVGAAAVAAVLAFLSHPPEALVAGGELSSRYTLLKDLNTHMGTLLQTWQRRCHLRLTAGRY